MTPRQAINRINHYAAGTAILPSDVVSGRIYLRLLNDFKAYDIRRQQEMDRLNAEIEHLRETLKSTIRRSQEGVRDLQAAKDREMQYIREERDNYRDALERMARKGSDKDKIRRQKAQISTLVIQNFELRERLRAIPAEINKQK